MTRPPVHVGLEAAVAQLQQAEACAAQHGCAPCRREADDLRARLIGRRVRWATARDAGTVMQITDVTPEGLLEVTFYTGQFAPHLFREVPHA